MAITYDQLVTLVKDSVQSDGEATFEAHIDDFIKHAEETITKNCQIPPMTKKQTGNFSIGGGTITPNSDFIAPLRFEYTNAAGQIIQLKHKDETFMVCDGLINESGDPRYYSWAFVGSGSLRLRLRPTPTATHAYVLEYSCRPASLTDGAGSGTTWISANMQSALVYGTLMYAYLYLVELEEVASYERMFNEAMGLTKIEQEGKARDDWRRKGVKRQPVSDDQ